MNTKNPVNKKPFRRACLPLALTALLPLSTMAMPAEPLFIEAENYNPGGEGVGYHDLDNRNRGNYDNGRSETVGLSAISATSAERRTSDGPATVSYVAAREWLAYDINVPEAGTYQFEIRSARAPAGESRIHLEVDGVDVSGPLMIASTGEPWRYQTFSFP
ncbi:MAG: carbohydrate-binding protein, partial [Gammaproteobacteria bacterium]|nr:carbohydrate-binding protein [Gammaproteobacteria bacterium]